MSVAIALLESMYKGESGRIMLLTGGPCSVGPGKVRTGDLLMLEAVQRGSLISRRYSAGMLDGKGSLSNRIMF